LAAGTAPVSHGPQHCVAVRPRGYPVPTARRDRAGVPPRWRSGLSVTWQRPPGQALARRRLPAEAKPRRAQKQGARERGRLVKMKHGAPLELDPVGCDAGDTHVADELELQCLILVVVPTNAGDFPLLGKSRKQRGVVFTQSRRDALVAST